VTWAILCREWKEREARVEGEGRKGKSSAARLKMSSRHYPQILFIGYNDFLFSYINIGVAIHYLEKRISGAMTRARTCFAALTITSQP
jgi:hypothetical protein